MNIENFWNVIEQCKDCVRPEFKLQRVMEMYSTEDVKEFQCHFDTLATHACRFDIHAAARLLNGSCHDKEFTDFRHGLILKGRAVYESVLKNPDHLHALWEQSRINKDAVHYVALGVYAAKRGIDWSNACHEIYYDHDVEGGDIYIDGELFEFPDIDSWDVEDEQENWKHLPRLSELYYNGLYSMFAQWVREARRALQ